MIYLCNGRQRQGKTTLAKYIANQSPTRVLYDPRKQFHTSTVIYTGSEAESLYSFLDREPEIIVRPGMEMEVLLDPVCAEILDWHDDNPNERICLLVDEANLVEMNAKPREAYPHFNYLLRSAGEENLNIVITAHRPTDAHPDIRAIAHYFCLFRITHEGDLRAVQEKCGEEVMLKVATLAPNELLVWNDNDGTYRLHPDREVWYVPLDKIPAKQREEG